MKAHRWIGVLLATMTLLAGPAAAPASELSAEDANRALATAFESAWNAHDMKAFGRLLTEDVVWINVGAGRGTGREFSWVTMKQGAEWKIRSSHNTNRSIVRLMFVQFGRDA
jgi:hypothetical protein